MVCRPELESRRVISLCEQNYRDKVLCLLEVKDMISLWKWSRVSALRCSG